MSVCHWILGTGAALVIAPVGAAAIGSALLVPFSGLGGINSFPAALIGCTALTLTWGLPAHVLLSVMRIRALRAYLAAGVLPVIAAAATQWLESDTTSVRGVVATLWLCSLGAGCAGIGWYVAVGPTSPSGAE